MSNNRLNDEFFAELGKKIPSFKQKIADVKLKNMEKHGQKEMPCPVCGKLYNSWNGFKERKPHCDVCAGLLKEGYTALVSMDSRFAFVKFPAATKDEAAAVAGKIMKVSAEQMDKAQANGAKVEKPENN